MDVLRIMPKPLDIQNPEEWQMTYPVYIVVFDLDRQKNEIVSVLV